MADKQKNTYETLAALVTVLVLVYWLTDIRLFLIAGLVIGLLGSLIRPAASFFHFIWMRIARGLNFIISNLLLGLVFFLVLSPIAFFYRLFNQKKLMTYKNKSTSYSEVDHEITPRDLIHPW